MQEERQEVTWIGSFTPDDRAQIEQLRAGQLHAIQAGDADAYTQLCASDVCSLLPGHDLVIGRDAFHAFQTRVLGTIDFTGIQKHPVRVERSGDLAIEIGRQELPVATATFATRQKYTHVMRKTPEGWRFVVLMSNASG